MVDVLQFGAEALAAFLNLLTKEHLPPDFTLQYIDDRLALIGNTGKKSQIANLEAVRSEILLLAEAAFLDMVKSLSLDAVVQRISAAREKLSILSSDPVERHLLKINRFQDGLTLEAVAIEFRLTRQRVQQIEAKLYNKIQALSKFRLFYSAESMVALLLKNTESLELQENRICRPLGLTFGYLESLLNGAPGCITGAFWSAEDINSHIDLVALNLEQPFSEVQLHEAYARLFPNTTRGPRDFLQAGLFAGVIVPDDNKRFSILNSALSSQAQIASILLRFPEGIHWREMTALLPARHGEVRWLSKLFQNPYAYACGEGKYRHMRFFSLDADAQILVSGFVREVLEACPGNTLNLPTVRYVLQKYFSCQVDYFELRLLVQLHGFFLHFRRRFDAVSIKEFQEVNPFQLIVTSLFFLPGKFHLNELIAMNGYRDRITFQPHALQLNEQGLVLWTDDSYEYLTKASSEGFLDNNTETLTRDLWEKFSSVRSETGVVSLGGVGLAGTSKRLEGFRGRHGAIQFTSFETEFSPGDEIRLVAAVLDDGRAFDIRYLEALLELGIGESLGFPDMPEIMRSHLEKVEEKELALRTKQFTEKWKERINRLTTELDARSVHDVAEGRHQIEMCDKKIKDLRKAMWIATDQGIKLNYQTLIQRAELDRVDRVDRLNRIEKEISEQRNTLIDEIERFRPFEPKLLSRRIIFWKVE